MHITGLIPCCTSPAFENTALLTEMTNPNPSSPILHKAEKKEKKKKKKLQTSVQSLSCSVLTHILDGRMCLCVQRYASQHDFEMKMLSSKSLSISVCFFPFSAPYLY